MTIVEALISSKEKDGEMFSCPQMGGWIAWKEDHVYRIPAEAMISTEWELSSTYIERITKGRWQLAPRNEQIPDGDDE